MPIGKNIRKEIECNLFNYSILPAESVYKKHIDLALKYFEKRPHYKVIKEFYFKSGIDKYRLKEWYYIKLNNELGYEKRKIQLMRVDIVLRIAITLAAVGFIELDV